MLYNLSVLLVLILTSYLSPIHALLATNNVVVTGNISFICVIFDPKHLTADDITFCSCTIIHQRWAITSRYCGVRSNWYLSPVDTNFINSSPKLLHTLSNVTEVGNFTLVGFKPDYEGEVPQIAPKILTQTTICDIYGVFLPYDDSVTVNSIDVSYKALHIEELLRTKIQALEYNEWNEKYGNTLAPLKPENVANALCLNLLQDEYIIINLFDRGAPIICDGNVQGVLVSQSKLFDVIPSDDDLPAECYGNINAQKIYAEGFPESHYLRIQSIINEIPQDKEY